MSLARPIRSSAPHGRTLRTLATLTASLVLSSSLALVACSVQSEPRSSQDAASIAVSAADLDYQYVKDGDRSVDLAAWYGDSIYQERGKAWTSAQAVAFVPRQFVRGVPSHNIENMVWVFSSAKRASGHFGDWLTPTFGARFTRLTDFCNLSFADWDTCFKPMAVPKIGDAAKGWWSTVAPAAEPAPDLQPVIMYIKGNVVVWLAASPYAGDEARQLSRAHLVKLAEGIEARITIR